MDQTFYLFSLFPLEVREMIWAHVYSNPRIIAIHDVGNSVGDRPIWQITPSANSQMLRRVNREARNAFMQLVLRGINRR